MSTTFVQFLCFLPFNNTNPKLLQSYCIWLTNIQGAAKRTLRFGRGIASGGEGVQWWGAHRRTAVYVPFSVYTMAWSGEHRAFIVEEFIKNGGSPVATQRAFRIHRFDPLRFFSLGLPQSKGLRTSPNFGSSEGGDMTGSCCHYT